MKITIVSDTHSLFRPELIPLLEGSDHILHLGDILELEILEALAKFAPVTAIRGNNDKTGPCALLPETEVVTLAGHSLFLLHNFRDLDLNPAAAGFSAVLCGHTHQPEIFWKRGVLYLNPGSCGPRRFKLPVTCARITIRPDNTLIPEILPLKI